MADKTEDKRDKWAASGVFVPAGMFIGLGIGWAFDYLVQGLIAGLGVGLLVMGLVHLKTGK